MNYLETCDYLFNIAPAFERVGAPAYKEGLANSLLLDARYGHPHRQYRTIHVAGTNGKGSCSHTIAAILQSAGYKVGLYTSPHLVDFRERIKVNGKCISEQYVIDFVDRERLFFEPLYPSFFEITTALAFKYFADENIDYAVIEVGLGGRLDCTNIITPTLSIITNISLDHTQFLGTTLAAIASEKAGIIKPGVPVVIGETTDETRPVFISKAAEVGSRIVFAEEHDEIISAKADHGGGVLYETKSFGELHGELLGLYQVPNTRTILCAVTELKKNAVINDNDCVRNGFACVSNLTGLAGRWQRIGNSPEVICDTGHNVGGWQYLSEQIKSKVCRQRRIVFGMVDDKDIDGVMRLLPQDAVYYFTQAHNKRSVPARVVMEKGKEHGLKGAFFDNVSDAYTNALTDANVDDFIFVGGSSYVVADLLAYLRNAK